MKKHLGGLMICLLLLIGVGFIYAGNPLPGAVGSMTGFGPITIISTLQPTFTVTTTVTPNYTATPYQPYPQVGLVTPTPGCYFNVTNLTVANAVTNVEINFLTDGNTSQIPIVQGQGVWNLMNTFFSTRVSDSAYILPNQAETIIVGGQGYYAHQ